MNRTTPFTPTKTPPRYRTPSRSQQIAPIEEIERLSGSKFGQDSQIRDIRSVLDSKYIPETEGWKNRWQDAEAKKSFLENENIRLAKEIEFWKGKNSFGDQERIQRIAGVDQSRKTQIESVRQLVDAQNEHLMLEADRLRGLLSLKIQECNEIRSKHNQLEILQQENANKKEVVQDYEIRINRLKGDYAAKMREIEDLKVQRSKLELESLEAQKAQRQAESLKNLLEAKREENTNIRREKSEVQGELAKSKQVETILLEKESFLKNELKNLEQNAFAAEETRKAIYLEKVTAQQAAQDFMKKSFHEEQNNLEAEIEKRSRIATTKASEADNLKRSYHELVDDLTVAEEESHLADEELRQWRERATQAERLKEQEIVRAVKVRDSSINLAVNETQREKRFLQEKLNNLSDIVNQRGNSLNQVQRQTAITESEMRALEGERAQLLAQVDALVRKQDDNERRFQTLLNQRDGVNSRSLEKTIRDHDNEKRRMNNQISALRNVIDQKREEAERARRDGNQFCLKLVNCENNARQAEGETQYWKDQTMRVSRQKSIEYETEKSLTQSQVRDLERVQSIEKIQKIQENQQLVGIIDYKDREAQQLRHTQIRTASELARDRQEKNRLLSEAELQRQRAIETERSKIHELRVKDSLHNDHVNAVTRSGIQQQNALRNEANLLANTLVSKDLSARNWRDNYSRLASSPYRKY